MTDCFTVHELRKEIEDFLEIHYSISEGKAVKHAHVKEGIALFLKHIEETKS